MMKQILFAVAATLLLTGCADKVKKTLGMERTTPDEFSVVERAPLTVPPDFNLMPPSDGADMPVSGEVVAKELVLGSQSNAPKANGSSAAENLLLQKAGDADPTIRQKLSKETDAAQPETAAQKLGIVPSDAKGKALDPTEEAQRLKKQDVKTVPVAPATSAKK
jgi:PBP1b-binding outer membrane lipoprotein LpoB